MAVSLVRKGFAWNACPAEESDWHNLSATWTKLLPVLLSLSCWQRSIPTKCGWALAQLRSRSSAIISSNGNSLEQHMAQLLDQEDVPGVPNPLGSSPLAALRTG